MQDDASDKASITIEIGPPKYQSTIDKRARRALGIEGKQAILQADLTLRRVMSEGGEH
jgi:hypothetical protein